MKASPSAKLAEADFDVMTAEPHHTGSPYEIKLADYVSDQFKQFGIEATKYEYGVLLPWPGRRRIDVVAPDTLKLEVEEEKIRGDQWADKPGILPAYNAYSPSGDVTGEIVYVNYGIPADYDTLKKLGIDVKGKIVLARYGGSWRGIKPKVAAEHGAIACIIYSDPHEDGYFQGDVYPDGPFRGWGMIQRGSVMDMPRYPGDPSTPGRPSKPGVERLAMDKIETFAPIPVQPMSYRDGLELLKRLKGPVAPEAWRGSLPLTYHIGPGPAKVHMNLQMDYAQRRLINVVGRIAGAVGAGRMDHRRIAPRRVDVRRVRLGQRSRVDDERRPRDGRHDEEGLEAAAQRALRQLGRRRAGSARLDRVGRRSRGRAESEGGDLRQSGRRRRRAELRRQRRALADAVSPRAGAVDPAGGRVEVALRRLARARARAGAGA